jgi:hypothetical protein
MQAETSVFRCWILRNQSTLPHASLSISEQGALVSGTSCRRAVNVDVKVVSHIQGVPVVCFMQQ